MSIRKNDHYRNMPFCQELSRDDFYTYNRIADLKIACENNKEKITKIRSIGALESINGQFYITDVAPLKEDSSKILVSMAYIKTPLQSFSMPYCVQIFGTIQWEDAPVIFARIIQVINNTTAQRLNEIMSSICSSHLAALNSIE